jgi:NNP family nitrate/nitrite transporter-like MFS transporter
MAVAALAVLAASAQRSLVLFCAGFIALFALSGLGNGSTYKMIPTVFARPMPGAVIGITGAAGALGGAGVNLAFRQSFLAYGTGDLAYLGFIVAYLVCMIMTWVVYLRPANQRLAG